MNKSDVRIIDSVKYIDNAKLFKGLETGIITNSTRIVKGANGVPYISFTPFEQFDFIRQGFSTRLGGVSTGIFESMNLAFNRDDDIKLVTDNFKLITNAIGTNSDNCVYSKQTHTTNVLKVGKEHLGMGITRERNFDNIDGLVTNEKGVCLVTAFADCIPIYFIDVKHRCIGASHSGWKGTVGNITKETLALMNNEYGTLPKDIYAFIGPGICVNCYEVSEDVVSQFKNVYSKDIDKIVIPKTDGKYLLNLPMANYYNMVNEGIRPDRIGVSDICTCCNPKLLYSHRESKGQRGGLCGFIEIKYK